MSLVLHFRFLFEISVAGLACYSLLCAYVRKNFCHTQVLRFFVRAILLSVRKNCLTDVQLGHDDRILFTERLPQWAIKRAR